MVRRLEMRISYWEVTVEVGNDYGEPTHIETRQYDTAEQFSHALENMSYYDMIIGIKEIVEYKI